MEILALLLAIFFVFCIREIVCWYWKINEMISLLQEMTQLSKDQKEIQIQTLAFIKATQKGT